MLTLLTAIVAHVFSHIANWNYLFISAAFNTESFFFEDKVLFFRMLIIKLNGILLSDGMICKRQMKKMNQNKIVLDANNVQHIFYC